LKFLLDGAVALSRFTVAGQTEGPVNDTTDNEYPDNYIGAMSKHFHSLKNPLEKSSGCFKNVCPGYHQKMLHGIILYVYPAKVLIFPTEKKRVCIPVK
jgi:hypothetical protein